MKVDLEGPFPLEVGDTFLLCSDGLSRAGQRSGNRLDDGCLAAEDAVRALVDLANLRGGPDNITVIIARVVGRVQSERGDELPTTFGVRKAQTDDSSGRMGGDRLQAC